MKATIITQGEPFYIPIFLDRVLREFKEVIAIIILPRTPKRLALLSSAKELQGAFGWKYLLTYGALFISSAAGNNLGVFTLLNQPPKPIPFLFIG